MSFGYCAMNYLHESWGGVISGPASEAKPMDPNEAGLHQAKLAFRRPHFEDD